MKLPQSAPVPSQSSMIAKNDAGFRKDHAQPKR
jgi:hypothetical protein